MDRTAWIVVILCVFGLVGWQIYVAKQTRRGPRRSTSRQGNRHPRQPRKFLSLLQPQLSRKPRRRPSSQIELCREDRNTAKFRCRASPDESRRRHQGSRLLRQIAEKGQLVVLNSAQSAPIGAIIEQPSGSTPTLPEFTASTESNSVVQFERTTAEQVSIRKKFSFEKSSENKDNYVIEMDVDLENRGSKPYQTAGYFVALGSARRFIRRIIRRTPGWSGASMEGQRHRRWLVW